MGQTVLATRPDDRTDIEDEYDEIAFGEEALTWSNSKLVRAFAIVAIVFASVALVALMAMELTEDSISAELPAPVTTTIAPEQDPGPSEALAPQPAQTEAPVIVVGGDETPAGDPGTEPDASGSTTVTSAAPSSTATSSASSTATSTATSAANSSTSSTLNSSTAANRTSTTVTPRITAAPPKQISPSLPDRVTTTTRARTSTTKPPTTRATATTRVTTPAPTSSVPGGGGTNPAPRPRPDPTTTTTARASTTTTMGHGGHHPSSGSWVKVSQESARYTDRTVKTTHHLFDPYSNRAPAGWGASKIGFVVHCDSVMVKQIDPIVNPGSSKSGHLHEFFGNPNVTPHSTTQSLADTPMSRIQCTDTNDKSAYWSPVAYQGGSQVRAHHFKAYYKGQTPNTTPIPLGLRMIAGNAKATKNQSSQVGWWQSGSNNTMNSNRMISKSGSLLTLRINFPNCWDGKHLDSPDHISHMAYAKGQKCPASHPVKIPQVVTFTDYRTNGGSDFSLASGDWFTFHQDFWNVWDPDQMAALNKRCILAELNCRAKKSPALVPLGQKAVDIQGS